MKTVIEMAREAGGYDSPQYPDNLVMDAHDLERFAELVRADERAMMAEQPAQQEFVALEDVYLTIIQWDVGGGKRSRRELARRIVAKYTPPAHRTWVGLTNKDVYECEPKTDWYDSVEFARAIEAKLRSKNEDRN